MGDGLTRVARLLFGESAGAAEAKHPPGIPRIDAIRSDASAITANRLRSYFH